MLKPTNTNYLFKFSIVTAVYNVAPYLSEAIDSILSQDIGFLESVELILVDDGSTDCCPYICDMFLPSMTFLLSMIKRWILFLFLFFTSNKKTNHIA